MKILILAAAVLMAAPGVAQPPPPPPAQAGQYAEPGPEMQKGMQKGMQRGMQGAHMFAGMSAEGRAVLAEAMRETRGNRDAVQAARDRINGLVGADRLDAGALRTAMNEERQLLDSHHARRQQIMLAALQKLSTNDRKAFAMQAARSRAGMEKRMSDRRKQRDERRSTRPDTAR